MRTHYKTMFSLAALMILGMGFAVAPAEEKMSAQTRQSLKSAMENEAFASMKYRLFAEHARKEGKNALADLLEKTSNFEYHHFLEWADIYGLVGKDTDNIVSAITGEYQDDMKLYTGLAAKAEAAGDKQMAERFRMVLAEEKAHHEDFVKAISKALKPD